MGFRDLVVKGFQIQWGNETQDPTEELSEWIIFKAKKGDLNYQCTIRREELAGFNQGAYNAWEQYITCEVLKKYNDARQNWLNAFCNNGGNTDIIIHRTEPEEAYKIFDELAKLTNATIRNGRIFIENIRIDFRCGDINKLAGLRPNYFNTDSCLASDFLQLMADKVNGKELKDISDIIKLIQEVTYGNSRSDKI